MEGKAVGLVKELKALIAGRRSLVPQKMSDRVIEHRQLLELLEAANWAPSHKFTEPWRFRVYSGAARLRLADALVEAYWLEKGESGDERKAIKIQERVKAAGVVIGLLAAFSGKVPEWEEVAAMGCAVQNMHLLAEAMGIGLYWTTPSFAEQAKLRRFLEAADYERLLGVIYLGYPREGESRAMGSRGPVAEKTIFYEH